MHSSTSNSDSRLPDRIWGPVLVGSVLIALLLVAATELSLASKGYRTQQHDSPRFWGQERARASQFGMHALILVGDSRMQLDVDLGVLRRATGLQPVQLALNGEPTFVPVLEGLANDPTVQGTILVSFLDGADLEANIRDRSANYESEYERLRSQEIPTFRSVEAALDDFVFSSLRSYADGTRPADALRLRVFQPGRLPQFVMTLADRSQLADFTRVPMPKFYYGSALRKLGRDLPMPANATYADLDAALHQAISTIPPVDSSRFLRQLPYVESLVAAIRAHGGRVIFIKMPSSGFIREMERKRYPRELYWNRFVASTTAQTMHFEDDANLKQFVCPDGSHLDFRQRSAFTHALVHALSAAPATIAETAGTPKQQEDVLQRRVGVDSGPGRP